MRIGFDGKRATQNFTGLGNYSRHILSILSTFYPQDEHFIYTPKSLKNLEYSFEGEIKNPKKKFFKSLWRSFGIISDLKRDKIDIYHGLSNELPFGIKKANILSVVTIHDLIFLRFPDYYPWIDRKIYNFKCRYACENADRIIAVSEQTKRDIVDFYHIPADRIEVIYQNCNPIFKNPVSIDRKKEIKLKYNLPNQYLLNVGSIESRKNLILIVKALKFIPKELKLVVVGKETRYTEIVKQYMNKNGLQNRVHFLKNVSFDDLPGIFQQSEIFIYPSKFEGFGIPILEALCSGVPVIAATGSALEEAGGRGSLYVGPNDDSKLSELINLILENKGLRDKMITDGYEHAKQFSDEQIAPKLMGLYQKTLKDVKR